MHSAAVHASKRPSLLLVPRKEDRFLSLLFFRCGIYPRRAHRRWRVLIGVQLQAVVKRWAKHRVSLT